MRDETAEIDWTEYLGRPRVALDPELARSAASGKSVLITGAGGSIGSGVARAIVAANPRLLVLLDLSEGGLYECYRDIVADPRAARIRVLPVVGSVSDRLLLSSLFREGKTELILHAAAYKHVPLMEWNPFSAIANNAIGSYRLIATAREAGVGRLTMVSTDKAVNPRSIMGASKRIAEQVALSHAMDECRMNAIRLGNVLGSSGSVVPLFREQAQRGLPLTVAHPEATRYFLTPAEAEAAILRVAANSVTGKVFIADCGEAHRVVGLARYIASKYVNPSGYEIKYVGLRPGDKLCEELVADDEDTAPITTDSMRIVESTSPGIQEVVTAIRRLERAVEKRDLRALMETVLQLVPSYTPSETLKHEDLLTEAR